MNSIKNKKGFTLIELLAIIVILAVIMAIAIPQVLNVVNGSKNGAWKNNIKMISKAIELNTQLFDPETGNYKYTIDGLCKNPSKVNEISKSIDTKVTCSNGLFTLTGTGQFSGNSAIIDCSSGKCSSRVYAENSNYIIYSLKLDNDNKIVVPSGVTRRFDIKVTSLKDKESKYELYYTTNNNDISVNYTSLSIDTPSGTIDANSSKTLSVRINNESKSDAKVYFNVDDELINDANHIAALCDNETTFCISTTEQLVALANEVNSGDRKSGKTYYLENDLDLGGKFDTEGNMLEGSTNWTPIGDDGKWLPFSGTFDGDGHIIRKLYINAPDKPSALFDLVREGVIRKLGVEDSYIKGGSQSVSAIVHNLSKSTMEQCYNKANVDGGKSTAGLVGISQTGSTLKNCYNAGDVTGTTQFTAGISGYNSSSDFLRSYNSGNISSDGSESGGIVGGNAGTIKNTYNVGKLTVGRSGAGISGQLYKNGIIKDSYNSGVLSAKNGGIVGNVSNVTGQELSNNFYLNTTAEYGIWQSQNPDFQSKSNIGATPISASEMPSVLSVINGDNVFVEDTLNINNGNPILKWELQYR